MEMRGELRIDARPGVAWVVVGDQFGRVGEWACPITGSSIEGPPGVGVVRTCHIAGFGPVGPGVITERLTVFDPADRSLEYEAAEGMPSFIVRAVNRWSVHAGPCGVPEVCRDQEEPHCVRSVHDRRGSGRHPGQPLTRLPAGQWTG